MALRPLTDKDLGALADWFPTLTRALAVDEQRLAAIIDDARSRREALAVVEEEAEGLLLYRSDAPEARAAQVELLAVAPDRRRFGIGSRAVLGLEQRLAGRRVGRCYVLVPSDLGLGLYFWLRLGYRPLTQAEWPHPVEGKTAAWMLRELA